MLGAAWCVVLLGLGVTGVVLSHSSANSSHFSIFLMVFIPTGFFLSVAVVAVHIRKRLAVAAYRSAQGQTDV
jgi:hypothetical protein